jgi:hypothetical protein
MFSARASRSFSTFLSALDFLRASLRSAAFFFSCFSAILFSFSTCFSEASAFRFDAAISRFVGSFFPPFSEFLILGGLSIFFFFPFFDGNFLFEPSSFATSSNLSSRLVPTPPARAARRPDSQLGEVMDSLPLSLLHEDYSSTSFDSQPDCC